MPGATFDIDEHHTMEDVAITLGEAIDRALGTKAGIARYGFAPADGRLPGAGAPRLRGPHRLRMGRRIPPRAGRRRSDGDVPPLLPLARVRRTVQPQISARGDNDHHKAEAIFKAFARALRMAVGRQGFGYDIPSSKGVL